MNATHRTPVADDLDVWMPFDDAYDAFAKANPMLGLGSTQWATTNLRRNFGPQLIAAGAVIKLMNRKWLAHREKFGPTLFTLIQREPAEIIAAAKARQAAAEQS
jgi:hypothetical protein